MPEDRTVDISKVMGACSEDLKLVEEHISEMFRNENPLVQAIGHYLLNSGGKRLRPLFLLLSARLSGNTGADNIALAGIVEVIHTASLLHDDVVDKAELRRGEPSANAIWGNAAVVLAGDYLYSNALKYALTFAEIRIIKALSSAITQMTEGELLQLNRSGDINITEDEYLRVVSAKTGALFSEACRVGAILGGVDAAREEALAQYGMNVGIAFQMVDDMLDYVARQDDLGKRLGKDLQEGKITLPLIYLLKAVNATERAEIKEVVEGDATDEDLKLILALIERYGVLDDATAHAASVVARAKSSLDVFADSEEKSLLMDIAEYSLYREK